MALADSVPGVSGGTIAFLMGFYDKFINSLNDIMGRDNAKRKEAFFFLIKLGIGWVIGMGISATVLASVFDKGIYKVSSLFLGFIIGAIPIMIFEEKKCLGEKFYNMLWIIVGAAVVVGICFIKPQTVDTIVNPKFGLLVYIFLVGMVAISAMVLPGISGSTVLLTFGIYIPIIKAVKEHLHFNFSGFPALCALALGCIAGIFVTLRLIKKALEKFRGGTVYCVVGMMIGSLYAIVQGPTTLGKAAMTFDSFNFVMFIIGLAIVLLMQAAKTYFSRS